MSEELPAFQLDLSAFKRREQDQARIICPAAEEIQPSIPKVTLEDLTEFMSDLCWRVTRWKDEGLETGAVAKERLQEVGQLARSLAKAIYALGPGAREVMLGASENESLRFDAEPDYLPTSHPYQMALSRECSEEEYWIEHGIHMRGGRWIIRLESLGELAEEKARWIEQNIRKGGQKSFEKLLGQSSQDWLLKQCEGLLAKYGCEDRNLVRKMAYSIQHAADGKPPGDQWGRKAVDRLFRTHPK